MPRRSNEFQHLVAMLTALSSDAAAVHESVELMEIASTETREVDVVAIGEVAGHQTVVCIECRDWKRPQTVEWVEQARTKFDDLGANVRVLVSSSGFTKPALAKAARHAIKTITPGEITPEFVRKVVNKADQAQYTHWVTYPQKGEVVITSGGYSQQIELQPNFSIFYADGSVATTFEVVASFVMRHHTRTHEDQWEEVLGKRHVAVGDSPEPRYNGQKVYIRGNSTSTGEEELFEIANVIVTFHAERTVAVVPLTHGEFDGTYYSTGTAPLGVDNAVQLVWTETADGEFDVMGKLDHLGIRVPPQTDEGHHDHRNPRRLLRTRRRRETPAGMFVRQPEDVGASAARGHPGGAAHGGTDHARQRLAWGDACSSHTAHHRARPGRGPGPGLGGPALAGCGAEPAGRGGLHVRADGRRVRLHRVGGRRLRRADSRLGVLAA